MQVTIGNADGEVKVWYADTRYLRTDNPEVAGVLAQAITEANKHTTILVRTNNVIMIPLVATDTVFAQVARGNHVDLNSSEKTKACNST